MPRKKKDKSNWDLDPQKSSAAQFLTYIASSGTGGEKYEIRYENENIWMSQKMLAAVYGIEVNSVNYHIKKIFADAELDESSVIRKIRITANDSKNYNTIEEVVTINLLKDGIIVVPDINFTKSLFIFNNPIIINNRINVINKIVLK